MTETYVRMQGLDAEAFYREESTGVVYHGMVLMEVGIPIPRRMGEYQAYQMHFVKEKA